MKTNNSNRESQGSYISPSSALPPPTLIRPKHMKLNYNQVLERANVIKKDKVEEKYRKNYPDLDINLVEVDLDPSISAMFEALVEAINEIK